MPTIAEAWFQEGYKKGFKMGEDAVKMFKIGSSDADIIKITGLPLDKIEQIRKLLKKSS